MSDMMLRPSWFVRSRWRGAWDHCRLCIDIPAMKPAARSFRKQRGAAGNVRPGTGTVTSAGSHRGANITVTGEATASHIHEGAAGANGPVIVPFTKTGDNTFVAPEGAKLTESQYASYKAGNLYVNVHSAKNPGGEVRAQLKGN